MDQPSFSSVDCDSGGKAEVGRQTVPPAIRSSARLQFSVGHKQEGVLPLFPFFSAKKNLFDWLLIAGKLRRPLCLR